jgi:rubrerythrin
MGVKFNAGEVLDMAIKIERNGAEFYATAAKNFKEEKAKKLLNKLAEWERGHELAFQAMKEDLGEAEKQSMAFDPNDEVRLYLNAMADRNVFNVDEAPAKALTGKETLQSVLRKALAMEKDSIVFYLGLKEMVPESLGHDKIDHIIHEEMGHIGYINDELNSL